MARQVLLHFPDFFKPFDVLTDASDYQLGGVIVQDNFPVAFYSRKLNSAQCNYTTMEKELLSIIETATHHRDILFGFKVNFHSDHKNLSFENFKSERVRRWRLLLEEFDYTFKYTPGKDNVVADMISRYPIINVNEQAVHEMNNIDEDDEFPLDSKVISHHQTRDNMLMQSMIANPKPTRPSSSTTPSCSFSRTKLSYHRHLFNLIMSITLEFSVLLRRLICILLVRDFAELWKPMSHHVLSAPSRSVPINSMVLFRPVKPSTSPGNVFTLTYLVPGLLNAAMENHDRFKPSPSSTAVFVGLSSMSKVQIFRRYLSSIRQEMVVSLSSS